MSKRGRGKVSHKGRNRHFITEAEMEAEREKERKDREWMQRRAVNRGADDDDDDNDDESEKEEESEESEEESESDDERVRKPKGVDGLIEINNPNRAQKTTKKVTDLNIDSQASLSRREREELERQEAHSHYLKLQAEGKTEQAQKDLARLAIIRKQREETARKRGEAKKAAEASSKSKK